MITTITEKNVEEQVKIIRTLVKKKGVIMASFDEDNQQVEQEKIWTKDTICFFRENPLSWDIDPVLYQKSIRNERERMWDK